jgi:hypothetical protein
MSEKLNKGMTEHELKGHKYLSEAEKKVNSVQGFLGTLIGNSSQIETAVDLYIRAANQFKICHKWKSILIFYYFITFFSIYYHQNSL